MASNIVGYILTYAMTTIITISIFIFASQYLEKINEIIVNKQIQDIAYKISYYLKSSTALVPNTTISYSFESPYIFLSVVKNTIRIEKTNVYGSHIYGENVSKIFDCESPEILDPYSGQILVKIDDGLYKSTGLNEIFVICSKNYHIVTNTSTKSSNFFKITFKKLNKSTILVNIL